MPAMSMKTMLDAGKGVRPGARGPGRMEGRRGTTALPRNFCGIRILGTRRDRPSEKPDSRSLRTGAGVKSQVQDPMAKVECRKDGRTIGRRGAMPLRNCIRTNHTQSYRIKVNQSESHRFLNLEPRMNTKKHEFNRQGTGFCQPSHEETEGAEVLAGGHFGSGVPDWGFRAKTAQRAVPTGNDPGESDRIRPNPSESDREIFKPRMKTKKNRQGLRHGARGPCGRPPSQKIQSPIPLRAGRRPMPSGRTRGLARAARRGLRALPAQMCAA
jgi:hypothetical protein